MSHARIEEVSDSDLSDPEEADIDDFADSEIMRRVPEPSSSSSSSSAAASAAAAAAATKRHTPTTTHSAPNPRSRGPEILLPETTYRQTNDPSAYKDFQCLYPVYFDATRSRAEGRRVSRALAVKNPLARVIANAVARLRLPVLFEPEKSHPKDWSNPGRVRVGLKNSGGGGGGLVSNKHHLYVLVAQYLRENPTTEDSPGLRVRINGVLSPEPSAPYPRPAVPRGWKMNELLPYFSPAMTGGGVSENLFKDMMKEMQGKQNPMAALMGGAAQEESFGGVKKKKDKKGKGKA